MPSHSRRLTFVRDIPNSYKFIQDSQDVEWVKDYLGKSKTEDYETFFIKQDTDGDITSAYGLTNTVPYMDKQAHKIRIGSKAFRV